MGSPSGSEPSTGASRKATLLPKITIKKSSTKKQRSNNLSSKLAASTKKSEEDDHCSLVTAATEATNNSSTESCSSNRTTPVTKKRVRFHSQEASFSASASPLALLADSTPSSDDDDIFPLWLTEAELVEIKQRERELCRVLKRHHILPALQQQQCNALRYAINEETRGLEHRVCFQRKPRQQKIRQRILEAQTRIRENPGKWTLPGSAVQALALYAQRATVYAQELAEEEAARDYRRAYGDDNEEHQVVCI